MHEGVNRALVDMWIGENYTCMSSPAKQEVLQELGWGNQENYHRAHIVSSLTDIRSWCKAVVTHRLTYLACSLSILSLLSYELDGLFIGKNVPNSIACQNQEPRAFIQHFVPHIGEGRNDLLLWRDPCLQLAGVFRVPTRGA